MTLFIAVLLSAASFAQEALPVTVLTPEPIVVLSAGQDRVCGYNATDAAKKTVCFPDLALVPFKDRESGQIKVTSGLFCTYDANGVRCTGESYYTDLLAIPKLSNVTDLGLPAYASAGMDACAIADGKVVCWGGSEAVTKVPDELKSPSAVATSGQDACAVDGDHYVKCWGEHSIGNSPYGVRNLKKLVMSENAACAVDGYGLMCWGPKSEVPEELRGDGFILDATVIRSQICVLTLEHQVRCFGEGAYDVPEFKNPIAISGFSNTICVTDTDGLKCWGRLSELPSEKPERLPPIWRPSRPGQCIDP